jgi:hypothetical protein
MFGVVLLLLWLLLPVALVASTSHMRAHSPVVRASRQVELTTPVLKVRLALGPFVVCTHTFTVWMAVAGSFRLKVAVAETPPVCFSVEATVLGSITPEGSNPSVMLSAKPVPVKVTSTVSLVRSVRPEGVIAVSVGETWAPAPPVKYKNKIAIAATARKVP